ncbi:MAG: SOS response-associated peptidase [Oscillospiraceae bacterium]|jgi:putative SOS response-associated peptidase YedK
MCGRYNFEWDPEGREGGRLYRLFTLKYPGSEIPQGEIFPGYLMPVLVDGSPKAELRLMTWGYSGMSQGSRRIINARAESVQEKNMFRADCGSRRCIVPTKGFYEWTPGPVKKKYLFSLPGSEMVYLAGIFNQKDEFTIITTDANESVLPVHKRMPLVISVQDIKDWLSRSDLTEQFLSSKGPVLTKLEITGGEDQ